MPVPKRKVSKSRRDKRQANKGIKPKAIALCSHCQSPLMPHTACSDCGFYKGKKVLATKSDRLAKRGEVRKKVAQEQEDHEGHDHESHGQAK